MAKKQLRGQKFQDEYKGLVYFAAAFGLYPPGFEVRVKNVYIQWTVYSLSIIMVTVSHIYSTLFFILLFFTNVFSNKAMFFLYFRRVIACGPLMAKITFHVIPAGYRKMAKIFETWNDIINVDFYVEKRQKILNERIRNSRWLFAFTVFFSCGLLQVPTLILFRGRHAYGAKYAVFPHDPDEWYHWYLVALQFLNFFVSNLGALCFNIYLYIIMLMANTQFTILQESLRDIFYDGSKYGDGQQLEQFVKSTENVKDVRARLKKWTMVHQQTIEWLEEVKSLFKITSAIKFAFLGVYICLAVFTVPDYIKSGRTTELIFVIAYSFGNYTLLFFESRLADELYETSAAVCTGAFDTNWCAYPKDIRVALKFIHFNSILRPFRIKAFGIFFDNSATFLSIMQSAYQALSFLLRIDI